MWQLLVPLIASGLSAGAMTYWASTNVYQNMAISEDKANQLKYNYRKLAFDQRQWMQEQYDREEDYERSLFQTGLIEAYDQNSQVVQANMQASQMDFDAQVFNSKQLQIAEDRNTYLKNQAFQAFTGSILDDRYTLAYIITELEKLQGGKEQKDNYDPRELYFDAYEEEEKLYIDESFVTY